MHARVGDSQLVNKLGDVEGQKRALRGSASSIRAGAAAFRQPAWHQRLHAGRPRSESALPAARSDTLRRLSLRRRVA
jgi:hypothetical protein